MTDLCIFPPIMIFSHKDWSQSGFQQQFRGAFGRVSKSLILGDRGVSVLVVVLTTVLVLCYLDAPMWQRSEWFFSMDEQGCRCVFYTFLESIRHRGYLPRTLLTSMLKKVNPPKTKVFFQSKQGSFGLYLDVPGSEDQWLGPMGDFTYL